jgi:hypothetical protein
MFMSSDNIVKSRYYAALCKVQYTICNSRKEVLDSTQQEIICKNERVFNSVSL